MNMFRFFQAIVNLGQDIMSTNENHPNALMREMDSTGTYHIWEGNIWDDHHVHFCVRDGMCLFFRNSALVDGIIFVDNYYREMDWEETQFEAPNLDGINPELWNEQQDRIVERLIERQDNTDRLLDRQRAFAESSEEQIAKFVDDMFGWMLHTTKGGWQ